MGRRWVLPRAQRKFPAIAWLAQSSKTSFLGGLLAALGSAERGGASRHADSSEAAVIDQLRGIFRQPEIIVGTWRAARTEQLKVTEDEAREALIQ